MNPDGTTKSRSVPISCMHQSHPLEKVAVTRHFQARWASQHLGCLLLCTLTVWHSVRNGDILVWLSIIIFCHLLYAFAYLTSSRHDWLCGVVFTCWFISYSCLLAYNLTSRYHFYVLKKATVEFCIIPAVYTQFGLAILLAFFWSIWQ